MIALDTPKEDGSNDVFIDAVQQEEEINDSRLLMHITKQAPGKHGTVPKLLSQTHNKAIRDKAKTKDEVLKKDQEETIVVNGITYMRKINAHNISYRVSKGDTSPNIQGALVDRGANGGLAGEDICVLETRIE